MGKVKDYYQHRQKQTDYNLQEYYLYLWERESTKEKAKKIKKHLKKGTK